MATGLSTAHCAPSTSGRSTYRCCLPTPSLHRNNFGRSTGRVRHVVATRATQPATGPGSHLSTDEDLLQHPDRLKWYEATFCANDMPDWNTAKFLRSEDAGPGMRNVVLEVEISREKVPLRNAHKAVGQRASVRAFNEPERSLTVASAPHPLSLNRHPLFLVRGDLFAYETKTAREPLSVKAEVHLLVGEREAPELYHAEEDLDVEVGPFTGGGLDLKGSGVMAVYRYPTVVMFVSGRGIATARSLLECSNDVANLSAHLRSDVRVYYLAPNEASHAYTDRYEAWSAAAAANGTCRLQVRPTTHSFARAFDDDDELTYDPATTCALILTGGDPEAEAAAREVCADAEITTILSDTAEASPLVHLDSTPQSFRRWVKN